MKNNIVLAGLITILGLTTFLWPSVACADRRPLDLPVGKSQSSDDERATEVITFFGHEYEGDAFFWCLDRSSSMIGEKIATLKREMYDSIAQISDRSDFGIVAFAFEVEYLSYRPMKATVANKRKAHRFVHSLSARGTTNMALGMKRTLQVANRSRMQNRQVILVGDGLPDSVSEALDAIATQNSRRLPIHTLYISSDDGGIRLFREIAELHGGSFRWVEL